MKEIAELYQDIQNLTQQIHQLEEAVAALIHGNTVFNENMLIISQYL